MTDDLTPEGGEFLRRMKRKRRRQWAIGIGVALLVIVVPLLAAYLYDCYWQHKVAVKVAQLRAQGKLLTFPEMLARDSYLPTEQNSALVYLKAFKLMQSESQAASPKATATTHPSQAVVDMLAAETTANAAALEAILKAAPMWEGCYPLEPAASPWDLSLRHVQDLRHAAEHCGHAAVIHAVRGEPADVPRYIVAGVDLAASVGSRALIVEGLVRIAADTTTINALERSLAFCQLAPDGLQVLKARLDRERNELSLDWGMISERSSAHFTFEHMVGTPGSLATLGAGGLTRRYGLMPGWREKDESFYDDLMDEMERIRALPQRQMLQEMKRFSESTDARLESTSPPPVVSALLFPALLRTPQLEAQAKVNLSMAAAALAAEEYRFKNGRWPDTLEQLVPEFLDAVPEDYFGTGKVHYVRSEVGVRIYSVGPDGQDNGGITADEADLQPGSKEGSDLAFRMLDPELRGAKAMAFREGVPGATLGGEALKAAGLDDAALKRLGLTDEDLTHLK